MKTANNQYMGKLLTIDLTTAQTKDKGLNAEIIKDFLGGTGLGIKILYDEVPEPVDPLNADNCLIFAVGPLTGSGVPGSGSYAVVTKSLLTGLAVAAHGNGLWGALLKKCGYDAVLFRGKAKEPVHVLIDDGEVRIEHARDLIGKDTMETEQILLNRYGEKNVSVACIGPAGEKLVRSALIHNDHGHVAASGGVGAVMGSKKLKAIVIRGTKRIRFEEGQRNELKRIIRKWNEESRQTGVGRIVSTIGSVGLFEPYYNRGWIPVKNLTTNIFEGHLDFDGENLREKHWERIRRRPCYGCTFQHVQDIRIKTGQYEGFVCEEPEYEDMAAWGPNVGIGDPGAAAKLTDVCDRLGIDTKEASFTMSMAMECFEKGIISDKETGGIHLTWGNVESIITMLEKIAARDGFGKILADGVMRAAQRIGKRAVDVAVYVKQGNAPHIHDTRTRWGTLFNQAISDMGSQQGIDFTLNISPDIGVNEPISDPDEMVAIGQVKSGPKRQLIDSAIFCYFCSPKLQTVVEAINVMTGLNMDVEDYLTVGKRIINLLRVFNIRNGFTSKHDSISARLVMPPKDGPKKGQTFGPIFEKVKSIYYDQMGWDTKTGKPLPETLRKLGLGFAIKQIWS